MIIRPRPAAAALCALALSLSACSGGGSSKSGGPSEGAQTNDITKLVSINSQPREALDQGGTLRLALADGLGPNFNTFSNAGNSADTMTALGPIDNAGCWLSKPDGTREVNKDYCESITEKVENGKQTVTFVLNPKAVWNDGTPIDIKTFENQLKVLGGSNKDFSVVSTRAYDQVESVKQGKDAREVVVTMKSVYEPFQDIFDGFIHPAVNTPEIFNKGFINNIRPEWRMGPYAVKSYDDAKKTLTLAPNPKWWGAKPQLDSIVFSVVSASASLPAFKNGELDATGAGTLSRYQQLESTPDVDFRRGQSTGVCGFVFNTKQPELKDVAVRKAVYQIINRQQLADVQYKAIKWSEKAPGSWMVLPISPYYQDNYPVKDSDAAGAAETLKSAGYTQGADKVFTKDGKKVSVSITNFGDDPTFNAVIQTLQKQITSAGIEAKIDQRPESAFNDTMAKRDFAINFMCYGAWPDAGPSVSQYYQSDSQGNVTSCGDPAVDALIKKVPTIVDDKERNKAANEVEKKWQESCYAMLPYRNGPAITATNKYLANFGPSVFATRDWTLVGWMKGHKK